MKVIKFDSVTSTNDIAKELIKKEFTDFAVCAEFQSFGQGRNNKTWKTERSSNLLLSIGIKHKDNITIEEAIIYQGIGCLAVINCLRELTGSQDFVIKYPNDILMKINNKFRKISGVIVNNGFIGDKCDYSIIGIGVNVNQLDFEQDLIDKACSLAMAGYEIEKDKVLDGIIKKIEAYKFLDIESIYKLWYFELGIVGKQIEIVGNESKSIKVVDFLIDGRLRAINTETNEEFFIDNGDSVIYNYE